MALVAFMAHTISAMLGGLLLIGLHRKIIARIQQRPGPPVWQELLHAFKFFFKETVTPRTASEPLYSGIVLLHMALMTGALLVILLGESLLIFMALLMIYKIVQHGAGLSSGSPYGRYAGVRSIFSLSSEVPMFAALAPIYALTGSLRLSDIISYQSSNGALITKIPLAAVAMYILLLSKVRWSPLDIASSKDLISGYKTEHYGVLRSILLFAEGIGLYAVLWLFIVLFFGELSPILCVIGGLLLLASLSFFCALTPVLTPHQSVILQIAFGAIMLLYAVLIYQGVV
ncbi:MAG: energy-converting hydrogenase subunit [Archaeoglobi archaeon]|nr:NADH-quinone oxidoreductase subunit H [Candidatus Mnemosynella bozhongmuii]MDI3502357.1 energy-converting hydrogenase subunit [Archaeoglobi archaeon]MDK2781842.1 energy-converting hydrogenase subunit [Archaeoglobi archaeon]